MSDIWLALLVGATVGGGGGGWLVKVGRGRGWVAEGFAGAAVLGLALCCYATSVALHGNGFIAAFTGGLAFTAAGGPAAKLVPFVEETGTMLSLLVWLMFGVIAVVPTLQSLTWQTVLYAVLSLTVIRMLPVAVALAGGTARPARRAVCGLVRPARPGVGGLRATRAGGPDQVRGETGGHRDRLHRAGQRACPRTECRPAGQALWSPAHPAARGR